MLFATKATPTTVDVVYLALPENLPTPAKLLLAAHLALESGWFGSIDPKKPTCFNWNLGNHKATAAEPHCFYECGENLPANTYPAGTPNVEVVREYTDKFGHKWEAYKFTP